MGFVIITDSRCKDERLVMVDRSKQKKSFWSNRLDDAFVFSDREAAIRKAKSFRFNSPRVACRNGLILNQTDYDDIGDHGVHPGEWDNHKNS